MGTTGEAQRRRRRARRERGRRGRQCAGRRGATAEVRKQQPAQQLPASSTSIDSRFAPREKWVRSLYMAIRRETSRVEQILGPEGSTFHHQLSDVQHGFLSGWNCQASTLVHCTAAAWCGQGDIVRWLLNHGARSDLRDGLHQLPIESHPRWIASVLGAATGIVDLSDKVEMAQRTFPRITAVGDRFQIKLARIQAELGKSTSKSRHLFVRRRERRYSSCAQRSRASWRVSSSGMSAPEIKTILWSGRKLLSWPSWEMR